MFSFIKKDSFLLGALLGLLIPALLYLILHLTNEALTVKASGKHYMRESTVQLLSLVVNVLLIRFLLIRKRYDKAGRGVLFATFLYAIIFMVMFLK